MEDNDESEESEGESEYVSGQNTNKRMNFVEDPAVLRAKAEERRQSKQGYSSRVFNSQHKNASENTGGSSKGQGPSKEVHDNKNKKIHHKPSRGGNHNRRSGFQHKRNQGMVPS